VNTVKSGVDPDDLDGMAITVRRPCRCGHARDQHDHYRRGSDCSSCACAAFSGVLEVTVRLGRQTGPVASVVLPDSVPAAYEPYVRPTHCAGLTGVPFEELAVHVVPPRPAEEPSMRKQHVG
jgi:hypothetical protein